MPLDYRILLGAQPPQPFSSLANMQQLGQMADEDRAQQQDRQAQQIIQQVLSKNADNPDAVPAELLRRGLAKQAMAFDEHLSKRRKAILDERNLQLDMEVKNGTLTKQKADLEKAAQADPKAILAYLVNQDDQVGYDEGKAMAKVVHGSKADAILASLPAVWSPDVKKRIAGMMLTPDQVMDNTRADLAAQTAAEAAKNAAADRLADNDRADKGLAQQMTIAQMGDARQRAAQAQTQAYQNAQLGLGRDRLAFDQKKEAAGTSPDGKVKLSVGQQDDITTANDVIGLIDEAEALGKQTEWRGVGYGVGTLAGAVKGLSGYGSNESEALRNAIGNLSGTIAKLRGGTSFTATEKALLNTYVPGINDGDATIQTKLKGLRSFLERRKANILKVASGNAAQIMGGNGSGSGSSGKVRVQGVDGQMYEFPSAAAAAAFKKAGG